MSDWTPQSGSQPQNLTDLPIDAMPAADSHTGTPVNAEADVQGGVQAAAQADPLAHEDSNLPSQTAGKIADGWRQARVWVRDLAVSLCLAGFVILFLYQPVKVEGTSMEPRLTDQERVFINKFIYRIDSVERGDVVVFWYPKDLTKSFIKRVVGVPGDRVEMRLGELFVNGQRIEEPYLSAGFRGGDSFAPVLVPLGEYFVLGDHRTSSNDSRSWGTVPQKYIYGKAELVYWPVDKWGLLD